MLQTDPDAPLRGDLRRRAVVDTRAIDWEPSPSGTVWRRRMHRVGPAESGQVTSIVRYEPGASFPPHDHPGGEEIFVLSGTFSDQTGDWAAGSYLLNPDGFRHAPFSKQGCVIFVKLRQYPGLDRETVRVDTETAAWEPTDLPGVEAKPLQVDPRFPESARLERWRSGATPGPIERPGGVELYVLEGVLEDDEGRYPAGTWLRLPDGASQRPRSPEGCVVFAKSAGVARLDGVVESDRR